MISPRNQNVGGFGPREANPATITHMALQHPTKTRRAIYDAARRVALREKEIPWVRCPKTN